MFLETYRAEIWKLNSSNEDGKKNIYIKINELRKNLSKNREILFRISLEILET